MAITSINEKLAVMEMDNVLEPGLPILPGVLGQDDRQQLLWGYPGVLWITITPDPVLENTFRFDLFIDQQRDFDLEL